MIASTFTPFTYPGRQSGNLQSFQGLGINPYGFQPYAEPATGERSARFDHRKPGIAYRSCRRTAAGGASAGADRAAASVPAAVGVGPVAGTSTTPASRPAVGDRTNSTAVAVQQQPFGQSTAAGAPLWGIGPTTFATQPSHVMADDGNVDRHDLRQD